MNDEPTIGHNRGVAGGELEAVPDEGEAPAETKTGSGAAGFFG